MNESLILILGQSPDEPVHWSVMTDGDVLRADIARSVNDLDDIVNDVQFSQVMAILPGELVAMRAVATPPKANAKFHAAAAYLLEDDLAESLDNLHVATSRHDSGAGLAMAVKKSVMDEWINGFSTIGLSPDVIVPDFSLLPVEARRAVFALFNKRLTGAVGLQGFAAERPLADQLAANFAQDENVDEVVIYGNTDAGGLDVGDKPVERRSLLDDAAVFKFYANALKNTRLLNLRQGAYRKRRDWRGAIGPMRRTAGLAAACVLAFASVSIADGIRSERLAGGLNEEAAALHMTAFPDQQNANPKDHARRVLSSRSTAPAFLQLSTQFADSLAENEKIQVDRIRYNAARGEFSINLRFSDINDLETLKIALASRGVIANETGGVRRSGGFYVGELQVSQS